MNYFKISKFFLVISVFYVVLVTTSTLFPFIVGKYVWFRSSVDLAMIFFLLGIIFTAGAKAYEERLTALIKKPLVIAVTAFVVIFLLAGFFGFDPHFSFWSNFERGEGGIQVLHLYLFFLLLLTLFREERDWHRIFFWSIIATSLMVIYGFLASSGVQGFIGPPFGEVNYRFQGSIGNSAYVAAYLLFAAFYCLYLLLTAYRKKLASIQGVFAAGLFLLFVATFILAATRGAFIGIIASFMALLVYVALLKKTWRKWLLSFGAVTLIIVGILVYFKDTSFVKNLPGSRIFQISISADTFQTRTIIWKVAIDGFKERPLLGWGPESFIQVFYRHFNPQYFTPSTGFGAWFDRAHSVFFDYLVETGAFGLVSYLGIFLVFYLRILKLSRVVSESSSKNRDNQYPSPNFVGQPTVIKGLIVAMPVAYLVQGLVLFDVLTISYNLFLFLAFAGYQFYLPNEKNNSKLGKQ